MQQVLPVEKLLAHYALVREAGVLLFEMCFHPPLSWKLQILTNVT